MENLFTYIVSMIITLGLLIFVHELGHFLTAKKFGIGVEKFSLGFGPKIVGKKWGETEYLISALPLGGYVKLVGEDPDEECSNVEKSFSAKPPFVKLLVAASGPIFNILLAVVILTILYLSGITLLAPIVGDVEKGTPAWEAGLRYGDEIKKIDDKEINSWDDLTAVVHKSAGKKLLFTISRNGKLLQKEIVPQERVITTILNESEKIGLIGIKPIALDPTIGGIKVGMAGEKAGLKPGDRIISVNGKEIEAFSELEYMTLDYLLTKNGGKIRVDVERKSKGDEKENLSISFEKEDIDESQMKLSLAAYLGIESTELYISEVKKDSPAEKAGLMPYDKIIKVDGKDLTEWAELQEAIAKKPNKRVSITFSRNGIEKEASLVLEEKEERDIMDNRIKVGALGAVSANNYTDVHFKTVSFSPFEAVGMALEKTVNLTVLMFRGIYKMITGKVSAKAISGPIAIAKMAGDQAKRGISQFASFVAFISINLGIINFIPLGTITDGGLIMLFTAEAIIRKPVNEKFKNATQYIGLALIFLIMGFALYNDFDRYLLDIIHFFKEIAGG